MTWQTDPEEGSVWAVQGAKSGARMARLQLQSATRSAQGIIEPPDLQVRAATIPDGTVTVAAGGCVVAGREQNFQGSYFGYNVGLDSVSIAPTGSGGGRSDLVVARVEDPTVEGPNVWEHALTDQLIYTRVIQGVSATAEDVPAGVVYSAVPLARIDIPANTATITQDMVTDLRTMLNPRTERTMRTMYGQGLEDGRYDLADFKTDFERWPQHNWEGLLIPSWATQLSVRADWMNALYPAPGAPGPTTRDARGQVRVGFIGSGGNNLYTTAPAYNFNPQGDTNGFRASTGLADTLTVPAAMRG
ncbi:hypothetical protein, partial [Nocardiopsis tropica]